MAEKKNQTAELRKARLELLKRNESHRLWWEKLVEKYKDSHPRDDIEKWVVNPAVRAYRFLSLDRGDFEDKRFISLNDALHGKAENPDFNFYGFWPPLNPINVLNSLLLKAPDSKGYKECPEKMLLLGIDLSLSKKAIMTEVETTIDYHRDKTESRLKWLSKIDEILQVWDLWEGFGQRRCFHLIAKRLKIPQSTVKARWRLAYKLIYEKEFTFEQSKDDAVKLCVRCKDNEKCYKARDGIDGLMEREPCAAYLKLAGSGYSREKLYENMEEIMSKNAYEDFLESEVDIED